MRKARGVWATGLTGVGATLVGFAIFGGTISSGISSTTGLILSALGGTLGFVAFFFVGDSDN
jgi:hypothetical protein